MITKVSLRNFQSLRNVDVELGPLTVIVGPSSSGKTAVVRALRSLATNARSSAVITHGADKATVTVSGKDVRGPWEVSWVRTPSSGSYVVREPKRHSSWAGQDTLGDPQEYTKLGGSVPDAVGTFLGIGTIARTLPPELCIAGQFDRPYLLDETGSKVATTLGDLTSVSVLFEAAREANRRKQSISTMLKTREADLSSVIEKLQDFKDLPSQIKKLDVAEKAVANALAARTASTRLSALLGQFDNATAVLAALPGDVVVPDFTAVDDARTRMFLFKDLIAQVGQHRQSVAKFEAERKAHINEVTSLEAKLHDVLVEAGQCPTCLQSTKEL